MTACSFSTEAFVVFSQAIPSQSLGFIDSKASTLDISVGGHDLTIHQSYGLLTSDRKTGTTGAGECASLAVFVAVYAWTQTFVSPLVLAWLGTDFGAKPSQPPSLHLTSLRVNHSPHPKLTRVAHEQPHITNHQR
jgi:hypothetical protein